MRDICFLNDSDGLEALPAAAQLWAACVKKTLWSEFGQNLQTRVASVPRRVREQDSFTAGSVGGELLYLRLTPSHLEVC